MQILLCGRHEARKGHERAHHVSDEDGDDQRTPQDEQAESHDGAYGSYDVYNTAEPWDQCEELYG